MFRVSNQNQSLLILIGIAYSKDQEDENGIAYTCNPEYVGLLGDLAYVWSDLVAFTGMRPGLEGVLIGESTHSPSDQEEQAPLQDLSSGTVYLLSV
jgi:hypothetical protein